MKILITGGCGFIGSNFISYLIKNRPEWDIVNIDKLTYAGKKLDINSSKYKFYKTDILSSAALNYIFKCEKPDMVVHFAAETHVDRSIKNPKIFYENNVMGTFNVLECSRKYDIKKFVHISTDEVYGSVEKGSSTENSPLKTNSPYSSSKAASDLMVMSYKSTFNLNMNITRCSNNFGPRQYPEKFIPLIISKIQKNEKIPIYGTGLNVRDWIYVEDHCSAVLEVLENGKSGEIYNIGARYEKKNIEIVNMILKILNKSDNLISYVEDRKGHDFRYSLDTSKINNELKWKPKFDFEKALVNTISWYTK